MAEAVTATVGAAVVCCLHQDRAEDGGNVVTFLSAKLDLNQCRAVTLP